MLHRTMLRPMLLRMRHTASRWAPPFPHDPAEVPTPIAQLRRQVKDEKAAGIARMLSLKTESMLTMELARSERPAQREEALMLGEQLWAELNDRSVPLTAPSRVALKMSLCSSLRRCALVSKEREAAERWTQRFADRTRFSEEDFMHARHGEDDEVLRNIHAGTGGTGSSSSSSSSRDSDGEKKDAKNNPHKTPKADSNANKRKRQLTAMDSFRQDVMMDHPVYGIALGRSPGPGPWYTG